MIERTPTGVTVTITLAAVPDAVTDLELLERAEQALQTERYRLQRGERAAAEALTFG